VSSACISIANTLSKIIKYEVTKGNYDVLLLSGGIDTSFIALSIRDSIKYAITVAFNYEAPDIKYARLVSNYLGLKHVITTLSNVKQVSKVIDEYLNELLPIIKTIDPIEVACDVPLYIGLKTALELGCNGVVTGDGGDELFLGYSFLLGRSEEDLKLWLNNVLRNATFSSVIIGNYLNIKVLTGLYITKVKYLAASTPISCCVNTLGKVLVGKYLLRSYLSMNGLIEVATRKKTPVIYGSGFNELLKLWSSKVSIDEAIKLGNKYGIKLPSRPHAYLLKKLIQLDLDLPRECSDESKRCPVCGSCLVNNFCRFCGTYLSKNGAVQHYSDELVRTWY